MGGRVEGGDGVITRAGRGGGRALAGVPAREGGRAGAGGLGWGGGGAGGEWVIDG